MYTEKIHCQCRGYHGRWASAALLKEEVAFDGQINNRGKLSRHQVCKRSKDLSAMWFLIERQATSIRGVTDVAVEKSGENLWRDEDQMSKPPETEQSFFLHVVRKGTCLPRIFSINLPRAAALERLIPVQITLKDQMISDGWKRESLKPNNSCDRKGRTPNGWPS